MNYVKWIGAVLGWTLGGPIGAIIGLVIGNSIDRMGQTDTPLLKDTRTSGAGRTSREAQKTKQKPKTTSGDFEVSLLILASIVIKADGKQDAQELDFVRAEFVRIYGKDRANKAFKLFNGIRNQNNISTMEVCLQIKNMMDHAARLQLINFLFGVAKADGKVGSEEVKSIQAISNYLGISAVDYNRIQAMYYDGSQQPYTILGLDKSATDAEVKRNYRNLIKKYHPDRVAHLGEEHQKGAEETFKKIQEAYETIEKERGF